MAVENNGVLPMVSGTGDTSYATNSTYQKVGSVKLKHLIEEAILGLLSQGFSDEIITVADLGCSSGPNSLWVVSEIISIIDTQCCFLGNRSSSAHFQYLVYLNDLMSNDFNTIFKTFLPSFYERFRRDKGEDFGPNCFVAAMPGSFYGRLFPSKSLHLAHSSYSIHWLSQVPTGLEDEVGNPINKGNVYLGEGTPPKAFEAYLKQFQKDFSTFLRLRAEEVAVGGRMVLILVGTRSGGTENYYGWLPVSRALDKTVSQGFIDQIKADKFNLPIYHPTIEELREVIVEEGSFHLNKVESHEVQEDNECETDETKIKMSLKTIRAIVGPMLAAHFGEDAMNRIFDNCRDVPLDCWEEDGRNAIHIGAYLTRKQY